MTNELVNGKTALMLAVVEDNVDNVRESLKIAGIDINKQGDHGLVALAFAIVLGHDTCFDLLTSYPGVDVNVKSEGNVSLLHIAIEVKKERYLEKLIELHADITCMNDSGHMPLHGAMCANDGKLVNIMIKAGADINAKTKRGMTPLQVGAYYGCIDSVKELLKHQPNTQEMFTDEAGRKLNAMMIANARGYMNVCRLVRGHQLTVMYG